jgi:glyoxylase-like metal-dependent hydrolase (beta-lactamase superfamily II)
MLRTLLAPNPSAMTLDGTRTFIVGNRRVAIIDPGPDDPSHLARVADAAGGAESVVLLTHQHPDHAAGAARLADILGAEVRSRAASTLDEGDEVATDAGALRVVSTPGHSPDHVALHWPDGSAIFVGDLMMGGIDTALVAPSEGGDLRAYLASLERLRGLGARVLYPAHGPEFTEPEAAFDRYRAHRLARLEQVRSAVSAGVRHRDALVTAVYGDSVAPALRAWTRSTLEAYLDYLGVEVE